MKKFLSILVSATLLFGIGTTVSAKADKNDPMQKAYDLIEKTNEEIYKEIEEAVEQAEKLQANYLADINQLEVKDQDLIKNNNGRLTGEEVCLRISQENSIEKVTGENLMMISIVN